MPGALDIVLLLRRPWRHAAPAGAPNKRDGLHGPAGRTRGHARRNHRVAALPGAVRRWNSNHRRPGRGRPRRRRTMSEVDLWLMARLVLQGAGVAVTPQATWPRLCRSISMLRRHRHLRKRLPPFRWITEAVLGPMEDAAAQALFDDWRMMCHAQTMAIMQDRIRPASVTLTLGGSTICKPGTHRTVSRGAHRSCGRTSPRSRASGGSVP